MDALHICPRLHTSCLPSPTSTPSLRSHHKHEGMDHASCHDAKCLPRAGSSYAAHCHCECTGDGKIDFANLCLEGCWSGWSAPRQSFMDACNCCDAVNGLAGYASPPAPFSSYSKQAWCSLSNYCYFRIVCLETHPDQVGGQCGQVLTAYMHAQASLLELHHNGEPKLLQNNTTENQPTDDLLNLLAQSTHTNTHARAAVGWCAHAW